MIKFRITPDRIAEACNIAEYIMIQGGHKDTIIRIAPRFVLDDEGKYIVDIVTDEEGDITDFKGINEAFMKMAGVTPKRMDKLVTEFREAVANLVNPPSAGA